MNGLTKTEAAKTLREKLLKTIKKSTGDFEEIGLMLSGGIDSSSILYALLDLKKKVHCYTFYLENYESPDLKSARRLCSIHNLPLTEVEIPLNSIKKNLIYLAKIGCNRKTQFETKIHYCYLFPEVKQEILLGGIEADNLQGSVRSMIFKSSKEPQKFKELRREAYEYATNINLPIDYQLAKNHDIILSYPFADREIYEFYLNFDWRYLNKPYEKWILLNAFPEYFKSDGYRRHSDMQINSSMRDHCATLVYDKDINPKGRKRINEVYKDLAELHQRHRK